MKRASQPIKDAAARAELYAKAVGYKVKRIVTISEQDYYPQPVPMVMQMRHAGHGGAPTPIAAGEVSLDADGERGVRADEVGAHALLKPKTPLRSSRAAFLLLGRKPRRFCYAMPVTTSFLSFRANDGRRPLLRFGLVHLREGGDDHAISRLEITARPRR
jgi:hypothetical protein